MKKGWIAYVEMQHARLVPNRIVCAQRCSWANTQANPEYVKSGFDQEGAAVLMARIAVYRLVHDEGADVLRWLDRMLIRLVCMALSARS
jgi:protein transport protein SEC23